MPEKLVLKCTQSPGDYLVMSAAVRDLHVCHPGRFITAVNTATPGVWKNNPYVSSKPKSEKWTEFVMKYPLVHRSNQIDLHFLWGYIDWLNSEKGLNIRLTDFRPAVYLTDEEKENRFGGLEGKYWVIVSGGKNDFVTKWWDPRRYQEVVDRLRGSISFVQVGGKSHHHPPLTGVVDMVGRTSFRQLMQLVYHSEGVVCPTTCLMHLAAALNKPCVVVAGGREPYTWEAYDCKTRMINMRHGQPQWEPPPNDDFVPHKFLHTIGELPCCKAHGCWKGRLQDPKNKGNICKRQVTVRRDLVLPECLAMISPKMVVENVVSYYNDTGLVLKPSEMIRVEDQKKPVEKKPARNVVQAVPTIHVSPRRGRRGLVALDDYRQRDMAYLDPPATIAVLTFGDFFNLHHRCLSSIITMTPRESYDLMIGTNAIGQQTREWLDNELRPQKHFKEFCHPENARKYPVMREMLAEVNTEWFIWFDDDSFVVNSEWLYRLAADIKAKHPRGVVMYGQKWFLHLREGQPEWVQSRPWYRGVPFPMDKGRVKVDFLTGGFWAIQTKVLKELDWPDPDIEHNGGDVMLCEALRQNGHRIGQSFYAVKINADEKGNNSKAPRRGFSQKPVGSK